MKMIDYEASYRVEASTLWNLMRPQSRIPLENLWLEMEEVINEFIPLDDEPHEFNLEDEIYDRLVEVMPNGFAEIDDCLVGPNDDGKDLLFAALKDYGNSNPHKVEIGFEAGWIITRL